MAKLCILFLANAPDADQFMLGQAACSIHRAIERCCHRDQFDLVTRWSVCPLDLGRELRELKPTVIHISAHGLPCTGTLTEMLRAACSPVRLVVMDACYSDALAQALLAHVDCVIGMDGRICDAAAIRFAVGFYGGLGQRESVATAFKRGRAVLEQGGGEALPRLKVRDGVDATRLMLAASAPDSPTGARAAAGSSPSSAVASTAASPDCPNVDPDGEVRSLVCKGEQAQALRLLMQRYGRDVYRFCLRVLGDPTLADDVHQQVFISAYRDLSQFAGRSTMRTWLFSIAHHRSIDALRCRARQESRQVDLAEVAGVSDPRPLATESLDCTQLLARVLYSLEVPAREALLLRYQQGLSFQEMARICDQRPAVLRMRVSRAVRQLREAMQARPEVANTSTPTRRVPV